MTGARLCWKVWARSWRRVSLADLGQAEESDHREGANHDHRRLRLEGQRRRADCSNPEGDGPNHVRL